MRATTPENPTEANQETQTEMETLRSRLREAEETLRAIREGEVDALVVATEEGDQIYTLQHAERPYRVLVESMLEGAATIGTDGLILYCNQRFAEMLQLPLQKVLGTSIYSFIVPSYRPTFEELLTERSSKNRRAELLLRADNNILIPVLVAVNTLPAGDVEAVCIVATDLSIQQQREQEVILLQRLQVAVNEAANLEMALHLVLRNIVEMTHSVYGEAWTQVDHLECSAAFFSGVEGLDRTWHEADLLNWRKTLIQGAWIRQELIVLGDIPFLPPATGIKAGVVVPVTAGSDVVTVLAFFAPDARHIDEHFIRVVSMIASQLGAFIRRRQMEDDIERARQELEIRVMERTSELRRANDQITHLQTVTTAFSAALTPAEVADVMAQQGFKVAGAGRGAVLVLSEDGRFLKLLKARHCTLKQTRAWRNLPVIASSRALATCVMTKKSLWNLPAKRLIPQFATGNEESPVQSRSRYANWAVVPLIVQEQVIGVLVLGFARTTRFEGDIVAFVHTIAEQCAQAMHRAQLYEQVQIAAAIEERQRLARDLHDAVSQTLFSASIMAEALPHLMQRNPATAAQKLGDVARLVRGASAEMRTLLLELRPSSLVNSDLDTLIVQLTQAIQGRKQITFAVDIPKPFYALPTDAHIAFYRIAQEALNNIVKHAHATQVMVYLASTPIAAELLIQDNGAGFDLDNSHIGLGLGMMGERAEAIGATLEIQSEVGQGTLIKVRRAAAAHPATSP